MSTAASSPGPAALRKPLVEQFVDVATRRLAAVLADSAAYCGDEPQFGADGVEIAHAAKRSDRAGARKPPRNPSSTSQEARKMNRPKNFI